MVDRKRGGMGAGSGLPALGLQLGVGTREAGRLEVPRPVLRTPLVPVSPHHLPS